MHGDKERDLPLMLGDDRMRNNWKTRNQYVSQSVEEESQLSNYDCSDLNNLLSGLLALSHVIKLSYRL